jgi:hypothetical protein
MSTTIGVELTLIVVIGALDGLIADRVLFPPESLLSSIPAFDAIVL